MRLWGFRMICPHCFKKFENKKYIGVMLQRINNLLNYIPTTPITAESLFKSLKIKHIYSMNRKTFQRDLLYLKKDKKIIMKVEWINNSYKTLINKEELKG